MAGSTEIGAENSPKKNHVLRALSVYRNAHSRRSSIGQNFAAQHDSSSKISVLVVM